MMTVAYTHHKEVMISNHKMKEKKEKSLLEIYKKSVVSSFLFKILSIFRHQFSAFLYNPEKFKVVWKKYGS